MRGDRCRPAIGGLQVHRRPTEERLATLAWIGLLVTAVPWEISSSLDLSVDSSASPLADGVKLLVVMASVGLAYLVRVRGRSLGPTEWLLIAYAGAALLGALLSPEIAVDGASRPLRIVGVVLAVHWVVSRLRMSQIVAALVWTAAAFSSMALAARAIGLEQPMDRLYGYLPYLHPNLLGFIAGIGLLGTIYMWDRRIIAGILAASHAGLFVLVLLATGSRTAPAVVVAGSILASILLATRLSGRILVLSWALVVSVVALVWIQLLTARGILGGIIYLATRGGTARIDPTLTGRTVAWQIALATPRTSLQLWLGSGLQFKTVVRHFGIEARTQGIDNAWIIAFLAAGAVGASLLVVVALCLVARVVRSGSPVMSAIALAVLLSSFTESWLSDATFALTVLVAVAAAARVARPAIQPTADERSFPAPAAALSQRL